MSNESEEAETLNNFFVTITDSLGIVENEDIVLPSEDISDPIDQIVPYPHRKCCYTFQIT